MIYLTNKKKQLAKLLKLYHKKWDCFGNLIKCKKKKYRKSNRDKIKEYKRLYYQKQKKLKQMHNFIDIANNALNKMKTINTNNLEVFKLFQ